MKRRIALSVIVLLFLVLCVPLAYIWWCTAVTVGVANRDAKPPAGLEQRLVDDVKFLAQPRSEQFVDHYRASENYIRRELERIGWEVHSENVPGQKTSAANLWVRTDGVDPPVIIGAHYDAAYDTPGADDNASGTAIALHLARAMYEKKFHRRVELVFFANEEPPYFRTDKMGSAVVAARTTEVCVMVSLEMLGYFVETPESQKYPWPLSLYYPSVGNFVGVVGSTNERDWVSLATGAFHKNSAVSAHGFAGPKSIRGLDYSDHMPFWNRGFDAIMLTDTSFFRNPNYHRTTDTWDTLNYEAMAQTALGVESVVAEFAAIKTCN